MCGKFTKLATWSPYFDIYAVYIIDPMFIALIFDTDMRYITERNDRISSLILATK